MSVFSLTDTRFPISFMISYIRSFCLPHSSGSITRSHKSSSICHKVGMKRKYCCVWTYLQGPSVSDSVCIMTLCVHDPVCVALCAWPCVCDTMCMTPCVWLHAHDPLCIWPCVCAIACMLLQGIRSVSNMVQATQHSSSNTWTKVWEYHLEYSGKITMNLLCHTIKMR